MKQEIIEKLFNGKELDTDEIVIVSNSLKDNDIHVSDYNHEKDTIFEACGINEQEVNDAQKMFVEQYNNNQKISKTVEVVESMCMGNSKLRKLIIIQAIKYMKAANDPILRIILP